MLCERIVIRVKCIEERYYSKVQSVQSRERILGFKGVQKEDCLDLNCAEEGCYIVVYSVEEGF